MATPGRAFVMLVVLLAQLAISTPTSHAEAAPEMPPFLAAVVVEAPGGARGGASIGIAAGTTLGYDVGRDRPEPPAPVGGPWAEAYVLGAGTGSTNRLDRSLVPPGEERAWRVRAEAHGPPGTVRLRWDPADFAPLGSRFGVDVTWGGRTWDLRDEPVFTFEKPDGLASVTLDLRVAYLAGTTPTPPRELAASQGDRPGRVALSWSPPDEDGGQHVRAYIVYRAEGDEAFSPVARVVATNHLDDGRGLGSRYRYAVAAENRLGVGERSETVEAHGTGKPTALDAGETPPNMREQERNLTSLSLEERDAVVPPMGVDAVRVRGEQNVSDPRRYKVEAGLARSEPKRAEIFTGIPLDERLDVRLLETPGAGARVPGTTTWVSVATRDDGSNGVSRDESLILRFGARSGNEDLDDDVAIPYAGGLATVV